jgi:octaprenyl-diphosphate synthase
VTGKPSGNDLREHKVTLPLIAALPQLAAAEREDVRRLFEAPGPSDELVARVVSLVESHGGLAYARERASYYAARAEAALEALQPSAAREALLGAITYAVERRR